MNIGKLALMKTFEQAKNQGFPYVYVKIEAEGIEELIVVPEQSFGAKEKFYLNAYDDNLTHVMNKNVKITNIGFGNKTHLPNFI